MLADSYAPYVKVRSIVRRPGCDFAEGLIELYTLDGTLYYKIHMEGRELNATPGPSGCSSGGGCGTFFSSDLVLAPCSQPGWCTSYGVFLPNCPKCSVACPTCTNCDNRITDVWNPGHTQIICHKTCNTSSEWCATIRDLSVKVIEISEDGTNWTDIPDETVCVKGEYGSSPLCQEDSFCPNHQSIRGACSFGQFPPLCYPVGRAGTLPVGSRPEGCQPPNRSDP